MIRTLSGEITSVAELERLEEINLREHDYKGNSLISPLLWLRRGILGMRQMCFQ
jgi:hypothetical protein